MTDKPSLRDYIDRYAAGEIPRAEALATIAAWDFDEEWFDPAHTAPTHQDNTLAVINQGRGLGKLTAEDIDVIRERLKQRGF
uniref:Antitoxin VbhA domain-containing protein n=1 Tax=Streptomyces sp. NBC_00049 TaxID=2903617 RepID=A0AAU2JQF8_9ACTN